MGTVVAHNESLSAAAPGTNGHAHHPDHPEVESHKGRWFVRKVEALGPGGPYHARFMVIHTAPGATQASVLAGEWRDLERAFDTPEKAEDAALEAAKAMIDRLDLVR